MSLTDSQIRALKPEERQYKRFDEKGLYHRANYWDERVNMMQWWSDQLEAWKAS